MQTEKKVFRLWHKPHFLLCPVFYRFEILQSGHDLFFFLFFGFFFFFLGGGGGEEEETIN